MLVEWNSGKHEATVIIALKINRSRNVSESIDEDGYIQMQFINLKSLLCFSMSVHKRGVEFKEWVLVESVVVSLDSTNTFAKEDRKDIQEGKCSKAWKGPSCMVMGAIACTMMPSLVSDYAIVDVG
ncbi:hypothetical protein Tco_0655278 [Tanacetum coccineum]|uniref:Uncharacterized protein n=1 Tax=Tanacetum coccineum TaxID=301880 RepID=A0ABQ4X5J5_9ASTR